MAHDVFISYASEDKSIADAVCATLESQNIRCWIAPRDILAGVFWGDAIVEAILTSRCLVLVFSSHSNASVQVRREVERAVSNGIPVLPFRIEDVRPTEAMEYFISDTQWLDAFTPPHEAHLERVAEAVERLLAQRDSTKSIRPREKARARNPRLVDVRGTGTGACVPEDLTVYLRFVVQTNSVLDLRGLTGTGQNVAVPLEEVYVSLHAEVDNPVEREYDRGVLEQDVLELAERLRVRELTERQRRELRYRILVRESQITRARDQSEDLEVSAVIRRSRCAVILGDPGSGKSTVLRHVALTFARSLLTVQERTMTSHMAAHAVPNGDESSDLESVRLPILVGISAFADARRRNPGPTTRGFLRQLLSRAGTLARGEGLYSFAHLTFQEYFVARHLCVNPEAATEKIVGHIGQARWREPLLLGIAYLSRESPSAVEATFEAVLSAQTPYDALLHRNLLFAAAAVPECASVPMSVARKIAGGLVATYGGANRSLRREIANVVRLWGDTHYADVIDDILIEAMRSEDPARRGAAVGLAKEASWASPPVTRVLVQRMPHDGVEGELFYRTLTRLAEIAPNTFPADLLPFRQACLNDAPLKTVVVANRALQDLVKVLYDNRISVARPEFIAMDSSITPYLLQSLRQSGEGEPGNRAERALIALRQSLQGMLNATTPDRLFVDAVRASLILDYPVPPYLSQALRVRPGLGLQAVMEALRDATRVLTRSWGADEDDADVDYGRLDADAAKLMARLVLGAADLWRILEQPGETWAPVSSWLRSSLSVLVGEHGAAAMTPPPEDGVDIVKFVERDILVAIVHGLKGGGLHFRTGAAHRVMDNLQPALTEKSVGPRELVRHLNAIGTYVATPEGLSFVKLLLCSDQLGAQDAAVSMIAQMRDFTELYGYGDAIKNSTEKALRDLLSLGIPQIAEHAAVLLGEFGLFDELTLMQLVEALRSQDDTIRHRAQHVLSKERKASELSLMTLKALGKISLANASNGFEWVEIDGCMRAVNYDSEQFLSSLVNEAGRCSEAERPAYTCVLSNVGHLSREATRAFCAGLSDGSNTAVQISLAESSKHLLELKLLEDSQQNEIIAALLPLVTRPIDDEVQRAATKAIGLVQSRSSQLLKPS